MSHTRRVPASRHALQAVGSNGILSQRRYAHRGTTLATLRATINSIRWLAQTHRDTSTLVIYRATDIALKKMIVIDIDYDYLHDARLIISFTFHYIYFSAISH